MNIFWGALIVVAVTALAVTAMLIVGRRAPEGGFYSDSDRASGVFGVLATGFSVLLGFLIFLAFESYDAARSGAEVEALTVAQQIQTAQRLPAEVGDDLTGRAGVLRPVGRRRRVGPDGGRHARRRHQPVGGGDVRDPSRRRLADSRRRGGLRQVARSDRGSRGGPPGSGPRCRRDDAHPVVDRAVLHRRDHLRVLAGDGRQR